MSKATGASRHPIRDGIRDCIALFAPVLPFAFVFGVVVVESGVGHWLGWSTSPIIFGGAAQLTLLSLLGEGASLAAAVTAALIVGARHLLYSVALAPRFHGQPRWFRWIGPYVLVDQVFALSTVRDDDEDPATFRAYYLANGFSFWTLWMLSTAVGIYVGPLLPKTVDLAFAAPVLFTALLVMAIDRWEKAVVALVAALCALLASGFPNRVGLLVGAAVGIALGIALELRRQGPR
ncbi:MAG: AzlC family ABC transporter permease [Pseudomonadota bacterium]